MDKEPVLLEIKMKYEEFRKASIAQMYCSTVENSCQHEYCFLFAFGNQRGGRSLLIQHFISKTQGKLNQIQQFLWQEENCKPSLIRWVQSRLISGLILIQ